MILFWCDDYDNDNDDDDDDESPVKHYKTNLRNYWCCHAQRQ